MALNDTLANALSALKNSQMMGKRMCVIHPASRLIANVLRIAQRAGYVGEFELYDNGKAGVFKVQLQGSINNCGVVKPRHPIKSGEYEKWERMYLPASDFGLLIVSTNRGVLSHREARDEGLGGILLAYFY
jgi:small subunit ribosomal protein S8